MFSHCTNLESLPIQFNFPQSLNTIGNNFAKFMFSTLAILVLPENFNFPQNNECTSVGSYFANAMFYDCQQLVTLSQGFSFPKYLTSVGEYFARGVFYKCSSLKST